MADGREILGTSQIVVEDNKIRWHGSFDELKVFALTYLGLRGKWVSPGGQVKLYNNDGVIMKFSKQSSVLTLEGESSGTVKDLIFKAAECQLNTSTVSIEDEPYDERMKDSEAAKLQHRIDKLEEDLRAKISSIVDELTVISNQHKSQGVSREYASLLTKHNDDLTTENLKLKQENEELTNRLNLMTLAVADLQRKVEISENENHSLVTALKILQEQHNGGAGNPVGNNKTLKLGPTNTGQQLFKHVLVSEESTSNESKPIEVEVDDAADDSQSPDSQDSELTLTDNSIKSNEKTKQVLIIGDSMIKNIDPRKLSKKVVKKRSYPGKKADEIHDEIDNIYINNAETSHVIIHVGTNDLMTESVDLCVSRILKLARKTQSKFTDSKIGISSLIHREDINVSPKIDMVNGKLRELANKEDFNYIDNSQIDGSCLNGSKVHLNAKGSAYLACNFIKFIRPKGKVARQSTGFLKPIHQLGKLLTQLVTQQPILPLHKKPRH